MTTYIYYNLTNFTNNGNQTSIVNFIQNTNIIARGLPGVLVLAMIYIILFLHLKRIGYATESCFAATSFVGMIMALILYPLGLLTGTWFLIAILLAPISLVILWMVGE